MKNFFKFKYCILGLFFILVQSTLFVHGVFFTGSIHTKKMSNGKTQHIILLGDEHTTGSDQQVEDLLDYIPDQSLAIVEDMDYQKENPSKLNGLAKKISKKNKTVEVINVEFRQFLTTLLGGEVEGNDISIYGISSIADYLRRCDEHAKYSMRYSDGEILNATYAKFRTEMQYYRNVVQRCKDKLKQAIKENSDSCYFSTTLPREGLEGALEDCISYELDIRTLHHIYAHQDKEYIFVCAGEAHTNRIAKVLFRLGYRSIEEVYESYLFGKINWKPIEPPCKQIDIRKLLLQLPANSKKTKTDDTNFTMHSALATSCLLLGFKYAPQPWNNSWKSYKPAAPYSLDQLRKVMTGNSQTRPLNLVDQLRKFLHDRKRSRVFKSPRILQKHPILHRMRAIIQEYSKSEQRPLEELD